MKPPSITSVSSAAASYKPSPLEKVARALSPHAWSVEAEASDMPWLATAKASSLRKARAALQSLRQVDDETLNAVCAVGPDTNSGEFSYDNARSVLSAYFDHILTEGGEG